MMEYGQRSPIGSGLFQSLLRNKFQCLMFAARQERLLQGLMREIVRMTAQKQPLEVGVPLFPFSHSTLFRKDENHHPMGDDNVQSAPLPVSSPFEEPAVLANGSRQHTISPSGRSHWPVQEASGSPSHLDTDILSSSSAFMGS